jgi:hypothetical protein
MEPMNFLIFLAALSASILAFELMTSFQRAFASFGKGNRLDGVQIKNSSSFEPARDPIPSPKPKAFCVI